MNKKRIVWVLIMSFIVLVFPLLIFYRWILPDTDIQQIETEEGYKFVLKEEELNIFTPLKNIYRYSFEISYYEFCFRNIDSSIKMVYTNGSEEKIFVDDDLKTTLTISIEGEDISREIIKNMKICKIINLNEFNYVEWTFSTTFIANEKSQILYTEQIPGWEFSFKPEKWSKITLGFLFVLSWWAFVWLFTRMIYLILWGIDRNWFMNIYKK